jgi:hypothetical protein
LAGCGGANDDEEGPEDERQEDRPDNAVAI